MIDEDIRKYCISRWGSDASYYMEFESFLKEHQKADAIEYCNVTGFPIRAVYYFRPWTVISDEVSLRKALSHQNRDSREGEK